MGSQQSIIKALLQPAFYLFGTPTSWAECVGSLSGILMVFCNLRLWTAAWPLSILSSLSYLLVFLDSHIYGNASLQLLFIVMAIWGWWQWLRGKSDGQRLVVRPLPRRGRLLVVCAGIVLWPVVGWTLAHSTETDVPYWDAFPTAGSLLGQFLLARKHIENWPVWLAVNVVAMALFAYRGLWFTVGLYGLFAVLALAGWRSWLKQAHAYG